jgi:hypothetical protein
MEDAAIDLLRRVVGQGHWQDSLHESTWAIPSGLHSTITSFLRKYDHEKRKREEASNVES